MLTFFHSPHSRSSAILALVEEMGIRDRLDLRLVTIPRQDGSGGRDPANPHPEGKVPYLVHDGAGMSERAAILAYLTELFPEAGMGRQPGEAERGPFLSWLAYYAGVVEPVLIAEWAGVSHPWFTAAWRDSAAVTARLHAALADGRPWLLAGGFSAVDLLLQGPYAWYPQATPDDPLIRDWIARVAARPAVQRAQAFDAEAMARMAA
jgi:glutathione S-transferase